MSPSANYKILAQLRQALLASLTGLALLACAGKQTQPDSLPAAPAVQESEQTEPDLPEAEPQKDPEERFAEALTLMKQRKMAEAEAAFIVLAQEFPDATGPHTNLGIIFAKTNRDDAAIQAFTRAASADGSNASAFNWIGILNRKIGNYERARQSFEKAIEVKPDYAAALINLGLLLEQSMNQPEAAIAAYRRYRNAAGEDDLRVLPWIAELEARLAVKNSPAESTDSNEEAK